MNSEMIETIENNNHSAAKIATIMRGLGASILIGAISLFLLQGWDNGNDLSRFYLLMGHSILLAIIGFSSHLWMGESKGARLLLMICAISIPANFAVMGGLLYSHFAWDITSAAYPDFAFWKTQHPGEAITASIGMLIVSTGLMWLCFKVLARRSANFLTVLYVLANSLLLIPLRDHYSLGIIVPLAAFAILWFSHKAGARDSTLKTKDGIICRLLLLLPLALIAARSFWLYEPHAIFFAGLCTMVFIILRQIDGAMSLSSNHSPVNRFTKIALTAVSLITAMLASGAMAIALSSAFNIINGFLMTLFTWVLAVFMVDLARRHKHVQSAYRVAIAVLISLGAIATISLDNHLGSLLLGLTLGAVITSVGFFVQQKSVFVIGIITALCGLYGLCGQLLFDFDFTRWSSLAAIGVMSILAGSVIENKSKEIKQLAQSFNRWNY